MAESMTDHQAKPQKVYFYATCLVDLFYPDVGLAGIKLLEREGVEVIFPQDQSCCGQPAYTSGLNEQAREVAVAQLKLFAEDWPIVIPSGSCAAMFKRHYPKLFHGTEWEQLANDVAERSWDLTEFLLVVCQLKLQDYGEPIKVAMHTSCTARREMGLADVGPKLLAMLSNVDLIEHPRITECCGFGGTFSVRHPDISESLVQDKAQALLSTGVECFLSSDCGCLINVRGYAQKQNMRLEGQHIISFLWQRSNERG